MEGVISEGTEPFLDNVLGNDDTGMYHSDIHGYEFQPENILHVPWTTMQRKQKQDQAEPKIYVSPTLYPFHWLLKRSIFW